MSDIEIEIDGKKLQAKPDAMVIQVADEAGIYIPRFCYHKQLSVAANCRMCLVEIEKSPKALPACATPVLPGMKVFTRSPKAIAAQKAVMEFLLINHPLDCPICDQGGECELQDLSMGYGSDRSSYCEGKRSVKDQDIGPLVATDMTRCIQCTRCVRFGEEIAGFRELGGVNRGEDLEITTYVHHALHSEISGNIIDLCPVGALTSKPFRFTARAWELQQHPSIAAHDCIGSNIYVHTRRGKVMRVVPREKMDLNQMWLSDRDRYSYEGLYHADRVEKPLIKVNGSWQETDWQTALEFAVEGLQTVLKQNPEELGALVSPNATVEESYLLQKMLRNLGTSNIDHRLRQVDFRDQDIPYSSLSLTDLDECDVILLVGSNIQKEQPMAYVRVRKATLKGAQVIAINLMDYKFHFKTIAKQVVAPHELVDALASLAANVKDQASHEALASVLRSGKKIGILLGAQALNHPQASDIRALTKMIAEQTGASIGFLTEGANAMGAWLAGAVPHKNSMGQVTQGLDAQEMWKKPRKGYVLLNVEPDLDCADPVAATNALEQAQFVVALAIFKNSILEQYANVILPISPFTETSGTFVNMEGKWQSFTGVATPLGESRPAWKVLRVLANFLHCDDFDYSSSDAVRDELKNQVLSAVSQENTYRYQPISQKTEHVITRIGSIAPYSLDSLVRRAKSLQATQAIIEPHLAAAQIHPATAEKLQLKEMESILVKQEGDGRAHLHVVLNERVPENAILIAGGTPVASGLSQLFGPVEIQKA